MRAFARLRLGRLIGLTLVVIALLLGRHDTRRWILWGRWSYPYVGLLLMATSVWVAALWATFRVSRRREDAPHRLPLARASWDFGVLLWGAAFLSSTVDAPESAASIIDLNLFGSPTPVAALLQWASLLALFVAVAVHAYPRVNEHWVNPALSVAAAATALLLGEGLARVRAMSAPITMGFPTCSSLLWARRYVRLNHLGFRDREQVADPPRGTHRLLVIGDSFAFGVGITRIDDRFGEQLGALLAQVTGEHWETMNASRPDSHTLDEIGMLESVRHFRADVVVLIYVFNDINYLHPMTERTVLVGTPTNPLQRLQPARVLFKNSYLFQELYVRLRHHSRSLQGQRLATEAYSDSAAVRAHLSDLARFVAEAERAGALVGIVPFDQTVAEEASSRERDGRFTAQALASGLPVWRVDQAFAGLRLAQLRVNSLDGHPNELANRLAAEAVLPQLITALHTGRERSRLARAQRQQVRRPSAQHPQPRAVVGRAAQAGPGSPRVNEEARLFE